MLACFCSASWNPWCTSKCVVVEDIVVQDVAAQQYEQEFEAFQSGKYKESAQNWLHSSWQGDALQAGTFSRMLLPIECVFAVLHVWAIVLPQQNSESLECEC